MKSRIKAISDIDVAMSQQLVNKSNNVLKFNYKYDIKLKLELSYYWKPLQQLVPLAPKLMPSILENSKQNIQQEAPATLCAIYHNLNGKWKEKLINQQYYKTLQVLQQQIIHYFILTEHQLSDASNQTKSNQYETVMYPALKTPAGGKLNGIIMSHHPKLSAATTQNKLNDFYVQFFNKDFKIRIIGVYAPPSKDEIYYEILKKFQTQIAVDKITKEYSILVGDLNAAVGLFPADPVPNKRGEFLKTYPQHCDE